MTSAAHANISQVTPNLWIGGDLAVEQPTLATAQLTELDALGITDIVDCRQEWNDQDWVTAAMPDMQYRWLGVDDAGQRMPDDGSRPARHTSESGSTRAEQSSRTATWASTEARRWGRSPADARLGPDRSSRPDP